MATANLTLTTEWQAVVSPGQQFLLSLITGGSIEVATSDSVTVSGVLYGHQLRSEENDAVGRSIVGPGYVLARASAPDSSAIIALTAWAE